MLERALEEVPGCWGVMVVVSGVVLQMLIALET